MKNLNIYRESKGKQIPGVSFSAFIHNGGEYYLTDIEIYKDGRIYGCWGPPVSFDEFKKKVYKGWIVTSLPENATLRISDLCEVKATTVTNFMEADEFIKEVADTINQLNGRQTSADICLLAYDNYIAQRTEEARDQLKKAYESVPEHNRRFMLGDQDVKDIPIRMIIYGEEEVENWSHRIASKQLGLEPIPTITVPPLANATQEKKMVKPWWKFWA